MKLRIPAIVLLASLSASCTPAVRAIPAPAHPLPAEALSADVTRFSFIAYGDTRAYPDGVAPQPVHTRLVDAMLVAIENLRTSSYPVRFVLQTGDAVTNGQQPVQWNASFIDVVGRLTQEGDVPYFMIPGNHDVTMLLDLDAPMRKTGLKNYLRAMAQLIPPEGSPRRLSGYPTYAFGFGNTFVIGVDSNISPDPKQFQWVKNQFEGLDRVRFPNVVVFLHHGPFTSGLHGEFPEEATLGVRSLYMPLFRTHHVNMVVAGHEHLFEHWVERYKDDGGDHRMDLVVSAGGGAPLYGYTGEPDTAEYLDSGRAQDVQLDHIVKPFPNPDDNPYHFVIVRVDGGQFSIQAVAIEPASDFQPYGVRVFELRD